MVQAHNAQGHPSYLLGQNSESGFWYYYPVALAVKTPIGFLVLAAAALLLMWNGSAPSGLWSSCAFAAGVLAVGLFSRINIGVRHILPVYVTFALLAACACLHALTHPKKPPWMKWAVSALLVWGIAAPALAHPDYLAYFNEFTPSDPETVLVDSDLDWGQDMKRLANRLHEVGALEVAFSPFIVAHLERAHGFPPIQPNDPRAPAPGWNAVSVTMLKLNRLGLDPASKVQLWPESVKPQERVGRSILLYHFQEPAR